MNNPKANHMYALRLVFHYVHRLWYVMLRQYTQKPRTSNKYSCAYSMFVGNVCLSKRSIQNKSK